MSIAGFDFFSAPRIVFGRGKFAQLGELAAPLGRKAIIVHNTSAATEASLSNRIASLLTSADVAAHFIRQAGEPTVADIDTGLMAARDHHADMVIGVGGGSAIDAAKAVAGLLTNGGTALDYMEVVGKGQKITWPAAPWIAAPTTAGTGAEVTRNAVVGYPEKQFKASLRSELLLPRIALVDPEMGVGVRAEVTARSGMDALCQLIESYTSTGANPMTDALALKGIALAAPALPRAVANGQDLDAREAMALAALFSGITLTNAGLGAVHGFAAPLGANFPIPHGTICAALLPHVIRENVYTLQRESLTHPTLDRYAKLGRYLRANLLLSSSEAMDACFAFTADLVHKLKIPPLGTFGLQVSDIPAMIALARKAGSMRFNPVTLTDEALTRILQAGIEG